MEPSEVRKIVAQTLEDHRKTDPAYIWVLHQMERERAREEMWKKARDSALGHLLWVVIVVAGTAIWQFFTRAIHIRPPGN